METSFFAFIVFLSGSGNGSVDVDPYEKTKRDGSSDDWYLGKHSNKTCAESRLERTIKLINFMLCCSVLLTGKGVISTNTCLLEGKLPWNNPCGAAAKIYPTPVNISDHNWRHFVIILSELRQQFSELKAAYMGDQNIRSAINRCWNLDSDFFHLSGFPTPNTSKLTMRPESLNETVEALEDFENLAIILVFIEQMIWDEVTLNRNNAEQFCNIKDKIRDAMCKLQEYINDPILVDSVTPQRSIMKTEYRLGDRIRRLGRNYLVFKDARRYLDVTIHKYIRFMFARFSKR